MGCRKVGIPFTEKEKLGLETHVLAMQTILQATF